VLSAIAPACQTLTVSVNSVRVRSSSQLTPNQQHIHQVEFEHCKLRILKIPSPGVSSRPPTDNIVCLNKQQLKSASSLFFYSSRSKQRGLWPLQFILEPLTTHGLDEVTMLIRSFTNLVSTRHALEKTCHCLSRGQEWGTACHPLDPH